MAALRPATSGFRAAPVPFGSVTVTARIREIAQSRAACALGGPGDPLDQLVYAESLMSAGLALDRWVDAACASEPPTEGLGGVLLEALRREDRETVVEWIEVLAWFGICQAARSVTAAHRERLVVGAFTAFGWARDPTRDEEIIVRTLVQSALLEEPEIRWGPFFVGMCELAGAADRDIDEWMLLEDDTGLLEAVLAIWEPETG
jgi:hypothetical protein